jgi:hypothetical protein
MKTPTPTNGTDSLHRAVTALVDAGVEQLLVCVARGKGMQHFPLSRLPPELRTKIFEMALIHPTGIRIRAGEVWNQPTSGESESGHMVFLSHKSSTEHN